MIAEFDVGFHLYKEQRLSSFHKDFDFFSFFKDPVNLIFEHFLGNILEIRKFIVRLSRFYIDNSDLFSSSKMTQ